MKSREDVIMGIECNLNFAQRSDCECCGYKCDKDMFLSVPINLLADALALLKAQEPCEDWISRKQLKDEIQYYIDEAGWGEEVNKALGWCLEFIDHQEAVKWE